MFQTGRMRERQRDRQVDRQTERGRDRETDRQIERGREIERRGYIKRIKKKERHYQRLSKILSHSNDSRDFFTIKRNFE